MKLKIIILFAVLNFVLFPLNASPLREHKELFLKYFSEKEIQEIENIILEFDKLKVEREKMVNKISSSEEERNQYTKNYEKIEIKLEVFEKKIFEIGKNNTDKMTENSKFYTKKMNDRSIDKVKYKEFKNEFITKNKTFSVKSREISKLDNILFDLTRVKTGGRRMEGVWKDGKLCFSTNNVADTKLNKSSEEFHNEFFKGKIYQSSVFKISIFNFVFSLIIYFFITSIMKIIFYIKKDNDKKNIIKNNFRKIILISIGFFIINYLIMNFPLFGLSSESSNIINYVMKIEWLFFLVYAVKQFFPKKTEEN